MEYGLRDGRGDGNKTYRRVHCPGDTCVLVDERFEEVIQVLVDVVGLEGEDLLGAGCEATLTFLDQPSTSPSTTLALTIRSYPAP